MDARVEFVEDEPRPAPSAIDEVLVESRWARRLDRMIGHRGWRAVAVVALAATAIATFGSTPVVAAHRVAAPAVPTGPVGTGTLYNCVYFAIRPGTSTQVSVHVKSDSPCPDLSYGRLSWTPTTPTGP